MRGILAVTMALVLGNARSSAPADFLPFASDREQPLLDIAESQHHLFNFAFLDLPVRGLSSQNVKIPTMIPELS